VNDLLLSFYGDDFTGSTDAMESLERAGVRTMLFIDPPDAETLARYPGLRAVGVAGLTRSMPPNEMEAQLRPAFAKLKALGAPIVHYKVCSTFDSSPQVGSIGRAIDVGRDVFSEAPFVPLVVGAPELGRYCVFGNLFAEFGRDPGPFRLDRHPSMSRHPVTPADESDLRVHLARQTQKRIALLDVVSVERGPDSARAALDQLLTNKPDIVLVDVLYERHLSTIGGLLDAFASPQRPLFVVGSSGVGAALGSHWQSKGTVTPRREWAAPGPAKPLLVVSGSCSPVTKTQIEWALSHGFEEVVIEASLLTNGRLSETAMRHACDAAVAQLSAGRHIVVHTGREAAELVPSGAAGRFLAAVVRACVARTSVKRVLIAGGDTSGHLARELGVNALEMIAPLTPGAPLCRAHASAAPIDGLELNFKGGQVGPPDYFDLVARGAENAA
jgi:uncharacterized protein YgbK (DUF1537 family)